MANFEELEEVETAIHLASQADKSAKRDDDDLTRFEELFQQMEINHRLEQESKVQLGLPDLLAELEDVTAHQDVVDKMLQVTLKSEESSQIHAVCQKAVDVCQLSLALKTSNHKDIVKLVGELKGTSTEIMTTMAENLQLSQELANLEGQLKGLQGKIAKVEREIVDLKQNPETTAGVKSDRIQMLETKLNKTCGNYDFSRLLTQLLLMASEEDLNNPRIADLFVKCGLPAYD